MRKPVFVLDRKSDEARPVEACLHVVPSDTSQTHRPGDCLDRKEGELM